MYDLVTKIEKVWIGTTDGTLVPFDGLKEVQEIKDDLYVLDSYQGLDLAMDVSLEFTAYVDLHDRKNRIWKRIMNSHRRYIRSLKRAKEKERRRKLKEGSK